MTGGLKKAMDAEGVPAIMNLTIVPYGNAHLDGDTVTCQHGDDECSGNSWEQCAIAHYPDSVDHFPFCKLLWYPGR